MDVLYQRDRDDNFNDALFDGSDVPIKVHNMSIIKWNNVRFDEYVNVIHIK